MPGDNHHWVELRRGRIVGDIKFSEETVDDGMLVLFDSNVSVSGV